MITGFLCDLLCSRASDWGPLSILSSTWQPHGHRDALHVQDLKQGWDAATTPPPLGLCPRPSLQVGLGHHISSCPVERPIQELLAYGTRFI